VSRSDKAWTTVARKGWDAYTTAEKSGLEAPRNPYRAMSFARNAWRQGFELAQKGMPRP